MTKSGIYFGYSIRACRSCDQPIKACTVYTLFGMAMGIGQMAHSMFTWEPPSIFAIGGSLAPAGKEISGEIINRSKLSKNRQP